MSEVISLINLKGGVSKTTSVINLAYSLSLMDKKILIVDTDSQGNISTSLGLQADEFSNTLVNLMTEAIDGEVTVEDIRPCIRRVGNVDVLPSNLSLAAIDCKLMNAYGRERILKTVIDIIRDEYDFILIDCPPSLGLIVINALVASDYTLIPVEAHYLSFESMKVMLDTVNMVKKKLNPNLEIAGMFITKYQARTNLSKAVWELVTSTYGNNLKVFNDYIPYSIKVAEQALHSKSIVEMFPDHPVSVAYMKIAKELINYGK